MATTICDNCNSYNCSNPCEVCGSTHVDWDEWDDHHDIEIDSLD